MKLLPVNVKPQLIPLLSVQLLICLHTFVFPMLLLSPPYDSVFFHPSFVLKGFG